MFRLKRKMLAGMIILSITTTFTAFFLFIISWFFTISTATVFKKIMVVSFLVHLSCYVLYMILLVKQHSKK